MGTPMQFFYAHAGYSYDPKTETKVQGRWKCARLLAETELEVADREWCFTWQDDEDGDAHDMDGLDKACETNTCGGHEVLGCILRDRSGTVLGSLWGIVDPSREYRRVVEAELASEALAEIRASVFEAI